MSLHYTLANTRVVSACAGAAEEDPEEAQRLRPGAGVSACDEGGVLQH